MHRLKPHLIHALILSSLLLGNCSAGGRPTEGEGNDITASPESTFVEDKKYFADVTAVSVSGEPLNYVFTIEILSPDLGCNQYADWWEILSEEGELIYRRTLLHSHINEQPFSRSGGPVEVGADDVLIVRAHMYPDAYGGRAFKGSVNNGFDAQILSADFAAEVELLDPQPPECFN